jgi:hypothetical protein
VLAVALRDYGWFIITQDRLWMVAVPQAQCVQSATVATTPWWCEDSRGKGIGASSFTY